MSREETIEICTRIDNYLGDKIAESILNNISYDKMEARYGIMPISRTHFYRKKKMALRILNSRSLYEEESNGQLRIKMSVLEKYARQMPEDKNKNLYTKKAAGSDPAVILCGGYFNSNV